MFDDATSLLNKSANGYGSIVLIDIASELAPTNGGANLHRSKNRHKKCAVLAASEEINQVLGT
jgi:hypothetical protein